MMGRFRQMACKDRASLPKLFYLFPGLWYTSCTCFDSSSVNFESHVPLYLQRSLNHLYVWKKFFQKKKKICLVIVYKWINNFAFSLEREPVLIHKSPVSYKHCFLWCVIQNHKDIQRTPVYITIHSLKKSVEWCVSIWNHLFSKVF